MSETNMKVEVGEYYKKDSIYTFDGGCVVIIHKIIDNVIYIKNIHKIYTELSIYNYPIKLFKRRFDHLPGYDTPLYKAVNS